MSAQSYDKLSDYIWDVPRTGKQLFADPSPEATAMRHFQDYPISYATGTANVSIPLVKLPAGGATIALGLRYHTAAIKRNNAPTDVGLGWSMSGLGVISRQINGYPDEWTGDTAPYTWHNIKPISFCLDPINSWNWKYLQDIMTEYVDANYDVFSYAVPGYTGNFIIKCDTIKIGTEIFVNRTVKQLPDTDVRIDCHLSKSSGFNVYTFDLLTPEGVHYYFAEGERVTKTTDISPARYSFANSNYEAESVWHPVKIKDNKRECDTILITYRDGESWNYRENHTSTSQRLRVYKEYPSNSYIAGETVTRDVLNFSNTINSHQRRIPLAIKGRSGSIIFSGDKYTSTLMLKNASGDTIKNIILSNTDSHPDGRRKLDGIRIISDNITIENYRFTYYPINKDTGCDIFGYCNNDSRGYTSVLDLDLNWNGGIPDPNKISSASLKTITDHYGITTTLEYEPAEYEFKSKHSLFGHSIHIGHRLKSVTAECSLTGRTRKRTFLYEKPMCNFDLTELGYSDFLKQNGSYEETSSHDHIYYFGIIHTSAPTTKGQTLDEAVIYYRKVTEQISGTELQKPTQTIYEYNVDQMINQFIEADQFSTCRTVKSIRLEKLKELLNAYRLLGPDYRRFDIAYSKGYFREQFGSSPLLTCRTDYEMVNGVYMPRKLIRHYYSENDIDEPYVGAHCESIVMRQRGYNGNFELGIDCHGDMNSYFIKSYASRFICDSTIYITYYPDGNRRTIKQENLNFGSQLKSSPGFEYDTNILSSNTLSHTPLGKRISHGNESVTNSIILSWFSNNTLLSKISNNYNIRQLPEIEKWIFKTAEGIDSINHRYDYRLLDNGMTAVSRETIVTGNYSDEDTILITNRLFDDYDNQGRVTSYVDENGCNIKLKWMDLYDCMTKKTMTDVNLTTTYSHKPLVGCKSIQKPSGKKRLYIYKGGRLVSVNSSIYRILHEYEYGLYNDRYSSGYNQIISTTHYNKTTDIESPDFDSGQPRYNRSGSRPRRTSEIKPDTTITEAPEETDDIGYLDYIPNIGTMIDTVKYDGFGMPVVSIKQISGNRFVSNTTEYDALDRPVAQSLPFPGDNRNYYNDGHPYSYISYPATLTDQPLHVTLEGTMMQGHPQKSEYICNNTSTPALCCRHYRLKNHRNREIISCTEFYKAGELDVTKVTDPDGCVTLTFVDWRGMKILERRVLDDNTFADTYFLYDVLGNIRVILQPEAVTRMTLTDRTWTTDDEEIDKLAFVYRYDRRGNCTYNKVPGADAIEIRYDQLNRPAMRQTPHMKENNEYESFFYDPIGRLLARGISKNKISDRNIDVEDAWDDIPLMTASYIPQDSQDDCTGAETCSIYNFTDNRAEQLMKMTDLREQNFYDKYDFANILSDTLRTIVADKSFSDDYCYQGMLTGTVNHIYGRDNSDMNGDDKIYTVRFYDSEENLVGLYSTTATPGVLTSLEQTVGLQGNILSSVETVGDYKLIYDYEYDGCGFLVKEKITAAVNDKKHMYEASYIYDDIGRLASKTINGNNPFTIEYGYNIRGQMTSISSLAFTQKIKYDDASTPYYNGNIAETEDTYFGNNKLTRRYSYDQLNRLVSRTSSDSYNTSYTYNLNSSPVMIQRHGITSDLNTGLVDDITLTYDGNRPCRVYDDAGWSILEQSLDLMVPDTGSNNFEYDSSGRMIMDNTQQINKVTYNDNDTPTKLYMTNGSSIAYEYDAGGVRLSAMRCPSPDEIWKQTTRHIYTGSFEFDKDENSNIAVLSRINLPWGYMNAQGNIFSYVADYQGNIRAVVDSLGTAIQTTDYYPYGLPMATSTSPAANSYKYSGKELETDNGLTSYDFHARQYSPTINLFQSIDPKASTYPGLNPYLYCAANPIKFIDPTGEDIWKIDRRGKVVEHIITDKFDRFEFVDDDMKICIDKFGIEQVLTFGYGTVLNYRTETYAGLESLCYGKKSGIVDIFEVKGDDNATALFEMFAKNVTGVTDNEIALIRTGAPIINERNFITSGHHPNTETGTVPLFNGQLCNGYYFREHIHSHSTKTYPSKGDIKAKLDIQSFLYTSYGYVANFYIYHIPSKKYIYY